MKIAWMKFEGCTFNGEKMPEGQVRIAIFEAIDEHSSVIIGKSPYIGSLYKTNQLDTSPWWADEDLQRFTNGPFTFDGPFEDVLAELTRTLQEA